MSENPKPFYLNILLLNRDEVIAKQVASKTGLKRGGFFAKAASAAANKLVSDETIINSLASNLLEKITPAVREMGITANLSKKFQQGPFVVLKVEIVDIDESSLVLVAKGAEFHEKFQNLISAVGELGLSATVGPTIHSKMLKQVHEGMMAKFNEIIPQKLEEAGLHVQVNVCSSDDQAEFFFDFIEEFQK